MKSPGDHAPDLEGMFNNNISDWKWAPAEICRREHFHPNLMAFSESRATLCLVVRRSTHGDDFALSATGLDYLATMLKEGVRADGKAVKNGFVVLVNVDPQIKHFQHPFKIVSVSTVQEIRDRIQRQCIELNSGNYGSYYWITPDYSSGELNKGEDEWSLVAEQPSGEIK